MQQGDSKPPSSQGTIADLGRDSGEARSLSTIGRYVVLESIGMGGMGLVCAAYDPKLDRKVALKVLRSAADDRASTSGRSRLFREAQALAKLSHPNVVTVHDVDVFDGQVYIAMEFVEGTDLRAWLRERPRTWSAVLDKFIAAGRGLAAAHSAGIVHRDFKPANVLLGNGGEVRVADFGVAKARDGDRGLRPERRPMDAWVDTSVEAALIEEIQSNADRDLTIAGRLVGTPAYMAPEQHMGSALGTYTDQYSFCLSLYEALYGRLPFSGGDRSEQLARMMADKLPPTPKEGPGGPVPAWLHKVVARGLDHDPDARWPSMEALLAALARDPARRRRRLVGGVLASVAVIAISVLGWARGGGPVSVDRCEGVGETIAADWNESRKAELARAFAATHKPFADDATRAVEAALDDWTRDWADQRVRICRATHVDGDQSAQLMDLRIRCLDDRRRDFAALVEVFVEADADTVERAVKAAYSLRDPERCATVTDAGWADADGELDPMVAETVDGLHAILARAEALAALSKFDESLPLLEQVVAEARTIGHRRTVMLGLHGLAQSQSETGDEAAAEASLREAVELAAALGDAEQEARIWARLLHTVGYQRERAAEGRAWALAARGAIVRAGDLPELQIRYESALGALAFREGKYGEALEHYEAGHRLAAEHLGEDDPLTLKLLVNRGTGHATLGERERAIAVLTEAVDRFERVYGPSHPRIADVYYNLGNVYRTEDPERAEEALRKTLAIREDVFGPDAPQIAKVLLAIGNVALARDRPAAALAEFWRAAAIFIDSGDETSSELAVAMTNVGRAQTELGRYTEAEAAFARAWKIYDLLHAEAHPRRVWLHNYRCEAFSRAEAWSDAAAACRAGLGEFDRLARPPRGQLEAELLEKLVVASEHLGRADATARGRLAALSR